MKLDDLYREDNLDKFDEIYYYCPFCGLELKSGEHKSMGDVYSEWEEYGDGETVYTCLNCGDVRPSCTSGLDIDVESKKRSGYRDFLCTGKIGSYGSCKKTMKAYVKSPCYREKRCRDHLSDEVKNKIDEGSY